MKIDINRIVENKYTKIPFADLVDIVFTSDGTCRDCPKDAIAALIARLEQHCPMDGFGNIQTGEINELEAYIVSSLLLLHDHNI